MTLILCAAGDGCAAADALQTHVTLRAQVAVVAGRAFSLWSRIASTIGWVAHANVAVVVQGFATDGRTIEASSLHGIASLNTGARVLVITIRVFGTSTRGHIGHTGSHCFHTAVFGTGQPIVTGLRSARAGTRFANVIGGANQSIVARGSIRGGHRCADSLRTHCNETGVSRGGAGLGVGTFTHWGGVWVFTAADIVSGVELALGRIVGAAAKSAKAPNPDHKSQSSALHENHPNVRKSLRTVCAKRPEHTPHGPA